MTLAAMSSQTPQETGDRTSGSAIGDQPPPRRSRSEFVEILLAVITVVAATVGGPLGAVAAIGVVAALSALLATLREDPQLFRGAAKALRAPLKFAGRAWQPLVVAGSFIAAARLLPDQATVGNLANEFHQQAAQVLPVLLIGLALEAGYFRVRGRTMFEAGGAMVPAALLVVGEVVALAELAKDRDGGVNIIAGAMLAGTVALVVAALSRDVSSGESQSVAITVTEGATLNLEVNGSMITSTKPRT